MGLRDRIRDLGKSAAEHEADEIRAEHASLGAPENLPLADRQWACVYGAVRSVTLPPVTSVPVLEAEVYDGRTPVRLVWIGRRQIPGIEPGIFLRAEGRVCLSDGVATIRNPVYEIVPKR